MSAKIEALLAELVCGLSQTALEEQMPTQADVLENVVTEHMSQLRFLRDTLEAKGENAALCVHLSQMLTRLEVGWEYATILANRDYVARPDHDRELAKVLAV